MSVVYNELMVYYYQPTVDFPFNCRLSIKVLLFAKQAVLEIKISKEIGETAYISTTVFLI